MSMSGEAEDLGVKTEQFEFADDNKVDYATLQYLAFIGTEMLEDPTISEQKKKAVAWVLKNVEFELAEREEAEILANGLDEIEVQEHPPLTIRREQDA
jgi:hypothetical protein